MNELPESNTFRCKIMIPQSTDEKFINYHVERGLFNKETLKFISDLPEGIRYDFNFSSLEEFKKHLLEIL